MPPPESPVLVTGGSPLPDRPWSSRRSGQSRSARCDRIVWASPDRRRICGQTVRLQRTKVVLTRAERSRARNCERRRTTLNPACGRGFALPTSPLPASPSPRVAIGVTAGRSMWPSQGVQEAEDAVTFAARTSGKRRHSEHSRCHMTGNPSLYRGEASRTLDRSSQGGLR